MSQGIGKIQDRTRWVSAVSEGIKFLLPDPLSGLIYAKLFRAKDTLLINMKILTAIPCLNEEETIESVMDSVRESLDAFPNSEILVIDDGCTDRTVERAKAKGGIIISHGENRGVGIAFQNAVAYFLSHDFDVMVNIDADGQFDPQDIPKLIEPIGNGEADFVTASRFLDPDLYPQMPRVKFWGNKQMSSLISRLAGQKFYDVSCGFRAYSREALLNLNLHGEFTYTQETFMDFSFKGLRIREVPVKVKYFPNRESRVAKSLVYYSFKTFMIIFRAYRDYYPLRFFWSLSLVCSPGRW